MPVSCHVRNKPYWSACLSYPHVMLPKHHYRAKQHKSAAQPVAPRPQTVILHLIPTLQLRQVAHLSSLSLSLRGSILFFVKPLYGTQATQRMLLMFCSDGFWIAADGAAATGLLVGSYIADVAAAVALWLEFAGLDWLLQGMELRSHVS